MMRNLKWLLCGLTALMLTCGPLAAQDAPPKKERPKKARPAKAPRPPKKPPSMIRGELASLAEAAKFDDAQKAKLEEMLKSHKASQEAWARDNDAKAKDLKSQLDALNKQMQELSEGRRKLSSSQRDEVMALFGDDAKQAYQLKVLTEEAMRAAGGAKLTDEQKAKVASLAEEAFKALQATKDSREQLAIRAKLQGDVRSQVLTDEQKTAMRLSGLQGALVRDVRGVRLTKEQQEKVAAKAREIDGAMQEGRAAIAEAEAKAKAEQAKLAQAVKDAAKAVVDEVLTDEQRKQMAEAAKKRK